MQTVEEVLEDFKERGFLRGNKLEALRSAMFAYRLDVIKVLMDMGVDIHTNNDEVLRYASEYGLYEIVVYLLEKGANVHVFDEYPIRYAAENGHTDIVKLLHENGAKFKTANCSIFKHIVKCTYPKSIEMMQYVISKSKRNKTLLKDLVLTKAMATKVNNTMLLEFLNKEITLTEANITVNTKKDANAVITNSNEFNLIALE